LSPTYTLILCILGLKQHLPCQCIHKSSFLAQIIGNSPEINHFEIWAWSWSWFWFISPTFGWPI